MKISNIKNKYLNTCKEEEYNVLVDFYIFDDVSVMNAGLDDEYLIPYLRVDIVAINNIPLGSVVEFDKDEIESIRLNLENEVNDGI